MVLHVVTLSSHIYDLSRNSCINSVTTGQLGYQDCGMYRLKFVYLWQHWVNINSFCYLYSVLQCCYQ